LPPLCLQNELKRFSVELPDEHPRCAPAKGRPPLRQALLRCSASSLIAAPGSILRPSGRCCKPISTQASATRRRPDGFVTAASGGLKRGRRRSGLTPLQRRLTIALPLRL
jgi:hypothetical protein